MAKIVNFQDEITDIVGSIPAAITDAGEKIFDNGIYDVINRFAMINPSMLDLFAAESEFIPDQGHSLNNIKILNVTSNNATDDIVCIMVPDKFKTKVQKDSGSLYEATLNSPVCYISNGKLYTAPQQDYDVTIAAETIAVSFASGGALYTAVGGRPSVGDVFQVQSDVDFTDTELEKAKGSAPAKYDYFRVTNATVSSEAIEYIGVSKISEVVKGTVTAYATGSESSIASFPNNFYYLPILYTAYHIMIAKINGLAENSTVTTAFASTLTAIAKFAALITSLGTSVDAGDTILDAINFDAFTAAIAKVEAIISTQTADWDSFITAEDSEMAQATLSGTQARLGESSAQLAKIAEEIKQATAYSATAQGYGIEADAIAKEANSNLMYIQSRIADIASNANIFRATAAEIWGQYEKAFVPYQQQKEARS